MAMVDEDRHQALRASAASVRSSPGIRRLHLWGKALSDHTRLVILSLLKTHVELTATEIHHALNISHAAVSQHMKLLQDAGMVHVRRRGKWAYYRIDDSVKGLLPETSPP